MDIKAFEREQRERAVDFNWLPVGIDARPCPSQSHCDEQMSAAWDSVPVTPRPLRVRVSSPAARRLSGHQPRNLLEHAVITIVETDITNGLVDPRHLAGVSWWINNHDKHDESGAPFTNLTAV